MNLSNIDIHELLPQQPPFVMVGSLLSFSMEQTVTRTEILADNLFVDSGAFTPAGIIENIAQTCAARIGYVNKYILRRGIQLGFIGAIRNLRIERLPRVSEVIETTITTVEEVFGMTLVTARVAVEGATVATSEMKIALSNVESQNAADQ